MNRAKRPCSPIEEVDEMSTTTTELTSEVVPGGRPRLRDGEARLEPSVHIGDGSP
jgi:hypothetical protein